MVGWTILVWGACSGLGAIVFLKGVANELDRVQATLRQAEQTMKTGLRKRAAVAAQDRVAQAIAA